MINAMLVGKIAPFKPITYSKKPENYPGAPGLQRNFQNFLTDDVSQSSGRVDHIMRAMEPVMAPLSTNYRSPETDPRFQTPQYKKYDYTPDRKNYYANTGGPGGFDERL